jgi:hypothetical protein
MAGCVFMAFVSVENLRAPALVMTNPLPAVQAMIKQEGWDKVSALVRHAAAEQTRHDSKLWTEMQVLLGVILGGFLLLATQRRMAPLALCGMMVVLALFQYRLNPEITYQGRETDFPPGSTALGPMTRYLALQQVHFGVEIVKMIAGGILASYLFVFHTRRSRKDRTLDHVHSDSSN